MQHIIKARKAENSKNIMLFVYILASVVLAVNL